MHQDADAEALIKGVRFGTHTEQGLYEEPMARDAWLLYVLAKHFPERLPAMAANALDGITRSVTQNWYDSLGAGTTILALDAYATATSAAGDAQLSVAEVLKNNSNNNNTVRTLELPPGLMPKVAFDEDAKAIRFNSTADLKAYYLVSQSGFDRTPPKQAVSKGFEVIHELTDASGKVLSQIKMGEEAEVHVKVRAIEDRAVTQVALVDLLPGGFELVVPPQAAADSYQSASEDQADENSQTENSPGPEAQAEKEVTCGFCKGPAPPGLAYVEPQEDRVVVYLMLTKDVQELVYRIKATNAGSYVVPPAYGEAMYDRSRQASSAAGHIEVVRP
jgi:uncharacterized protein YfaS (alpha-2-macroglobulin family)